MLNISYAELNALIIAFFWPFTRILAFIASEPVLGNRSVPIRVKIGFAFLLTACVFPSLPAPPQIEVASAMGIWIMVQQILVGISMGFVVRIAFSIAEMAGQLAGSQMGLGFAIFFDPQHSAQVPIVGRFLGLIMLLYFLALNGHEIFIVTLVNSFHDIPISATPLSSNVALLVVRWGSNIFEAGLMMALPVIAALLVTNVALGIVTRAAPQLNIFSVGFPLTLSIGFYALFFMIPYLPQFFAYEFAKTAEILLQLLKTR